MFLKTVLKTTILLTLLGCDRSTPKVKKNVVVADDSSFGEIQINSEINSSNLTTIQKDIIFYHNEKRSIYFTDSPLTYSMELEREAKIYANTLADSGEFVHDIENNHKKNYGENLYASSENRPLTIVDAMPYWFDSEEPHYHYSDGSCDTSFQCGHYTQVIWQETKKVGCATAKYKTGKFKDGYVYICKYYKAGNSSLNGENLKPYCQSYDMSDVYIGNIPSKIFLKSKKFSIELIDEDRVNCIRTNIDNSVIEFSSDLKKATIPDFQIFNNGKYSNSLEFDSISISGATILLEGINRHISDESYKYKDIYMKIKLLGETRDYYSVDIEWNGLDKEYPKYSRSMRGKLYK